MIETLAHLGYDVVESANADDAIKVLRSGEPIALVLTNVQMPGQIDDLELANVIWSHFFRYQLSSSQAIPPCLPKRFSTMPASSLSHAR
ncbi:hypothetical protein [Pseudomonas plecoglossicida]|uniref:hypothetical protein n=1 Tax=Pseudomonas plecoglossicida TaxID=70775 RepID=UPI00215A0915|nr:hypothetical protein [Pseudomonas plecoglossicida]